MKYRFAINGVAKKDVITGMELAANCYLISKASRPEHSENQFLSSGLSFRINPFIAETHNEFVATGIFVAAAK